MHICLLSKSTFHHDRKALVTLHELETAGHEVSVVALDDAPAVPPVTVTVPRHMGSEGRIAELLRRWAPERTQQRARVRRMGVSAAHTGASLFIPLHEDVLGSAIEAARRQGGSVLRSPAMAPAGGRDLISLAPRRPELATPVAGTGPGFTSSRTTTPPQPAEGRLEGRKAVLCYRKTSANPGRYLESAMRRAGLDVRVETDQIDLSGVDPESEFVLFVESPYPALDVSGVTNVPTLYWVHHGEHHLHANLRMSDRYRADAVLLAHSWHLALWFPAPVHRFPFAVPTEIADHSRPLAQRRHDVAMVGSKLQGEAWQYETRGEMIHTLQSSLPPERLAFASGLTPEEMMKLYGDARVVINEGGKRHFPITMRIFEAIGAGAALLTDQPPGLDLLFEPGVEFATLTGDVESDVEKLLSDLSATQEMADRALREASRRHTYDHRVDDLLAVARSTEKREIIQAQPESELALLIDADVDVQRVIHDDLGGLDRELPDREVWPLSERVDGRLTPASMDAAVLRSGRAADNAPLLAAARKYLYVDGGVSGLDEYLAEHNPLAVVERVGSFDRVDMMAESYRVKPLGDPG